ncbi:MAG: hypothetical protein ACXACH_01740 [Candidatus Hermodarchaeia archaeon]
MSRTSVIITVLLLSVLTLTGFSIHMPYTATVEPRVNALPEAYSPRENDQQWSQFFDHEQSRQPLSIIESHQGGFVVAGHTIHGTSGLGDETVWLARTDSDGDIEWERVYMGEHRGWGEAIVECQNGDIALAGVIDDEFSTVLVMRIDSQGNQLWQQIFNFTQHQEAYSIIELPSGNLVVCGWIWTYRPTNPIDGLLICLDSSGSLLWHQRYGGVLDERFYSLTYVLGGGLAITGLTESYGNPLGQLWIVKTDLQGNIQWNVTSGGAAISRGHCIISNPQGDLTVAGVRQHEETERLDAFVLHTTSDGNQAWNLTLGEELDEVANAVIACSDGGYAIAGEVSQSDESPWHDMLVVRLDDYGRVLWQKAYGEEGNDIGISLVECSAGGFVLAGTTSSFGFLSGTAWLTRVPDAPPPLVDPRQVDLLTALLGMTLALIVLGVAAAIYLRSRRELNNRIRQCS